MPAIFTTGQVAMRLRISVSTLKRWLNRKELVLPEQRNPNGWRLFSEIDMNALNGYKKLRRKSGKRFNTAVLPPVGRSGGGKERLGG